MVRVLHVINSLRRLAGAQTLIASLAVALRNHGVLPTVYELRGESSILSDRLQSDGIEVVANQDLPLYSPLQVIRLVEHLRRNDYDLIHVHLFPAQLWTVMAAWIAGYDGRLVTTEHNTTNRRRHLPLRWMDKAMYMRYRSIVCITSDVAKSLIEWLPPVASRVCVIENGIELARFQHAQPYDRDVLPGGKDGTLLIMVARFEPQKDHQTLIRAVANLDGVQLLLVGDGSQRYRAEQLVEQLGLRNRVHFLGERQDIPELLKSVDVYVHSVWWEGFGLAVLEAMASGLPVVASDVAGLRNVIGDAGLLACTGDVDSLGAQLQAILSSKNLRETLAAKSAERARLFSIDATALQYARLYNRLISDTKVGDHTSAAPGICR